MGMLEVGKGALILFARCTFQSFFLQLEFGRGSYKHFLKFLFWVLFFNSRWILFLFSVVHHVAASSGAFPFI